MKRSPAVLAYIVFAAMPMGPAGAQPAPAAPTLSASASERIASQLAPAPTRADFAPLFRARRFAQIERMADARLAIDPRDVVSLVAKSSAIVGAQDAARLDLAANLAERAIEANPNDSNAHEALGNALGTKALVGGIASALGSAGTIRDSYKRAIELNPNNHAARFSLLQFYAVAPGFLGGGKARAQDLINQTGGQFPDAAKLLSAALALTGDNFASAEALALSVDSKGNEDMADQQRSVLASVGSRYVNDKRYADAERVFKDLTRRYPSQDIGLYGQARVLAEQGKHAEALAFYDQALALRQSASTHYRKAQSLQALGEKAKAAAAFEAAIAGRPPLSKNQLADAKERLAAVRG